MLIVLALAVLGAVSMMPILAVMAGKRNELQMRRASIQSLFKGRRLGFLKQHVQVYRSEAH